MPGSGTSGVGTFSQPSWSTEPNASTYKNKIDACFGAIGNFGTNFAVRQASTPNMTVVVEAGNICFTGNTSNNAFILKQSAQTSSVIPAPASNPRIDRICINAETGIISRVAGAEDVSPTPPVVSGNLICLAQIYLTPGMLTITNSHITDERGVVISEYSNRSKIYNNSLTVNGATTLNTLAVTSTSTLTDRVMLNTSSGNAKLDVNGDGRFHSGSVNFNGGVEGVNIDFAQGQARIGHVNGATGSAKSTSILSGGSVVAAFTSSSLIMSASSTSEGGRLTLNPGSSFSQAVHIDHESNNFRFIANGTVNKKATFDNLGSGALDVYIDDELYVRNVKVRGRRTARYTYQLSNGSNGGARTANVWTQQPLNTEIYDDIGITLNSNTLNLPAGTYDISGEVLFGSTNFGNSIGRLRLRNVTNDSVFGNSFSTSNVIVTPHAANIKSTLNSVRIILPSAKTIEVQYLANDTTAAYATSAGNDEIYADILVEQINS